MLHGLTNASGRLARICWLCRRRGDLDVSVKKLLKGDVIEVHALRHGKRVPHATSLVLVFVNTVEAGI